VIDGPRFATIVSKSERRGTICLVHRFLQWSPRTDEVVEINTASRPLSRYWLARTTPPVISTAGDFVLGTIQVAASLAEGLPAAALHKFLGQLKYRGELMKEYIFEHVRQEQFTEWPSRRRCMFLFDATLDANAYRERLKLSHTSLYEVVITDGRVHRAQTSLLDCNVQPHDIITERARAYWSPVQPDMDTEVLFEGRATLRRVSDPTST
jgi:hypothetical protein